MVDIWPSPAVTVGRCPQNVENGAARSNGWMKIGSRRYQVEEVVENMKGAEVSLHLQQIHAPVPRDRLAALVRKDIFPRFPNNRNIDDDRFFGQVQEPKGS